MVRRFIVCAIATVSMVLPQTLDAQIRASERSTVSQTVDGTVITIDYSRPQLRGRTDLWGGEVPWGKKWTPGGNWATNIEVNNDVTINGHPLPAGHYSLWLEVQEDAWTAIFDADVRRFHLQGPSDSPSVQFTIQPETVAWSTEVLTFSFPTVKPTGTTLQLAWGDTHVNFDIGVPLSKPVTVAADVASRYVGTYGFKVVALLGGADHTIELSHENEHLVLRWPTAPLPRLRELWLMPLGAGMFAPIELENGEIFDILTFAAFEFSPYGGTATGFDFRGPGDALWGEGTRH